NEAEIDYNIYYTIRKSRGKWREGNEVGTLYFKDLSRNVNFQRESLDNVFNFVWGTDSRVIYYTVVDEQLRPHKVLAHTIGTSQHSDLVIFEEEDQSAFVDITCTKDKDNFYILTNADNVRNFKLVRAKLENIGKKYWETIFAVKETEKIEDVEIFRNFAVLFAKREGLPVIMCYDLWTSEIHQIRLPSKYCVVSPG
ncbi:2369_t:CDS:2, partial [Acaulospora colombiana]